MAKASLFLSIDKVIEQHIEDFEEELYREFRKLFKKLKRAVKTQHLSDVTPSHITVESENLLLTAEFDPELGKYVLIAADVLEGPEPRPPGTRLSYRKLASFIVHLIWDGSPRAIIFSEDLKRQRVMELLGNRAVNLDDRIQRAPANMHAAMKTRADILAKAHSRLLSSLEGEAVGTLQRTIRSTFDGRPKDSMAITTPLGDLCGPAPPAPTPISTRPGA